MFDMTDPRPLPRRAIPTVADRRAVLESANGRCTHCGATDVPLEIRFITPLLEGGGPERANLEAVCPNCHRVLDSEPSELFFARFIADLLESHPAFADVIREPALGRGSVRPDLIARELDGGGREILVECKSFPVLSQGRLENIRSQLQIYRDAAPGRTIVLAFPGQAAPEVMSALKADGVDVWTIDVIGTRFAEQIAASGDRYYPRLIEDALARARPEVGYLAQIRALAPGKEGWSTYQKLVGRLLELLFCPPLESPLGEKSDFDKVSRRDLIFANHASDGFWAALRQRYGADYILVDAKNGGRVRKSDVLQIANYLKPHGLGSFAIIIGRSGVERGVPFVLKEQWAFHRKLILVLNDDDLEDMVLAYGSGREQTQVLSDRIQAFRIGM